MKTHNGAKNLARMIVAALALAGSAGNCREKTDTPSGVAVSGAAAIAVAWETTGRVLVREAETSRYRGRVAAGFELMPGEAMLTGPGARVELRVGERGRWRVGERAVWRAGAKPGDAELRAGTAVAAVPAGARWRVGAASAAVSLGEGVWLLTAVDNEGLKIVALDGGRVDAEGAPGGEAPAGGPEERGRAARASTIKLRAGEVVFARPGGRGFGPVVTIFLDELLASSRLLTRFAEELPQMERLRQQGAAQRERLSLVSNAHVGGAKDAEGFQVIVPK